MLAKSENTQFILLQPARHKGNFLKNLFTKYTTYITNQTKQRTSIVPWSQIHGTGQSKPRTSVVIYVDFNEMLTHPADIQHRHTTGDRQSFNTRLHTQHTAIQSHILAQHKLHSIQLHTSNNNHKEHLLW